MTKEQIKSLRDSGNYPIVSLQIFDSIKKLEFSDFILDQEKDVIELYRHYLDEVSYMNPIDVSNFLQAIKNVEFIDNQALEKEDSFLMSLYAQTMKENAIDYLLHHMNPNLSRDSFIEAHKLLLCGTSSARYAEQDYRMDNEVFVGRHDGDEICIDYFTLPHDDIEEAIAKTLDFYDSSELDDHVFLKGQIVHGLVATLQMFSDGNTRYARILQNLKVYDLTSKNLGTNLGLPALYGTRSYFPWRGKYRELISHLAIDSCDNSWNEWFRFNLNRTEDSIYFLDHKLDGYKKMVYKK